MKRELTREEAVRLVKGQMVVCPSCGKSALIPLHKNREQHTRFRCPECEQVFRPIRQL